MLLTRSPLSLFEKQAFLKTSFDLHVLGMPPAFILSQDQTLHLIDSLCLNRLRVFCISSVNYFKFL